MNASFESASEGDYDTVEQAYRHAVASGLQIAAGEVLAGADSAIVQLSVDANGQSGVARGAVAVSTALLKANQPA